MSCKLYNSLKSNYLTVKHYKKINTISVNNNLADIENDISLNLSKINDNITAIKLINKNSQDNENDISSNLKK